MEKTIGRSLSSDFRGNLLVGFRALFFQHSFIFLTVALFTGAGASWVFFLIIEHSVL